MQVTDRLLRSLEEIAGFLPNLLAFLIILLIGYIVARVVRGLLTTVLQRAGLDRALHAGQTAPYVERFVPGASPSALIGSIVFFVILLVFVATAVSELEIQALTFFVGQVYSYLPNVVVAILIFVLAGALATAVGGLAHRTMGDTPTGRVVRAVAPTLVMGFAVFMILNQLQIAEEIVQITFTALVGSLALGLALAFGLGGREVAARILEDAYQKGQEQRDQVREDVHAARQRARRDAGEARRRAESQPQGEGGGQTETEPRSGGARRPASS